MTARNEDEARRDYQEAVKRLEAKREEYQLGQFVSGETKLGKPLTEEAQSELDKLADEVEKKEKIWMKFLR